MGLFSHWGERAAPVKDRFLASRLGEYHTECLMLTPVAHKLNGASMGSNAQGVVLHSRTSTQVTENYNLNGTSLV
jgi:hypothetical protein